MNEILACTKSFMLRAKKGMSCQLIGTSKNLKSPSTCVVCAAVYRRTLEYRILQAWGLQWMLLYGSIMSFWILTSPKGFLLPSKLFKHNSSFTSLYRWYAPQELRDVIIKLIEVPKTNRSLVCQIKDFLVYPPWSAYTPEGFVVVLRNLVGESFRYRDSTQQ